MMIIQMESGTVTEGPTVRLISEKVRRGEHPHPRRKNGYVTQLGVTVTKYQRQAHL